MSYLISILHNVQQSADVFPSTSIPEWLAAVAIAYQAGTLTRKQKRKLKWKLAWEMAKSKFSFRRKSERGGKVVVGILLILLCAGLTGLTFALGAPVWGTIFAISTLLLAVFIISGSKK